MISLGNIETTPLASLIFVPFKTGDIIGLTGRNLYGAESTLKLLCHYRMDWLKYSSLHTPSSPMRSQRARTACSIFNQAHTAPQSNYVLAEEDTQSTIFSLKQQPKALLTSHSSTIAAFEWESPAPIHAEPGQAVILDFSSLLGSREYRHISVARTSLVNDAFIHTWRISSAATNSLEMNSFSLTMREKQEG